MAELTRNPLTRKGFIASAMLRCGISEAPARGGYALGNEEDFMTDTAVWLARLARAVNDDAALVHRGRFVDTRVLFDTGASQHLIDIRRGRIEGVAHGPFVMPGWDLALRAPLSEWLVFWEAVPPPGHHDLMALIKRRVLRVEGNLHPFMANLLYFKAVLAAPRPARALASGEPA